MSIAFVLDEDLRGPLWQAIRHHNRRGINLIDATHVGNPVDLPLGTKDPALLIWAEAAGRIVVSKDINTMPGHLTDHLALGRFSPGVMIVRPGAALAPVLDFLVAATYASDPWDWENQCKYMP